MVRTLAALVSALTLSVGAASPSHHAANGQSLDICAEQGSLHLIAGWSQGGLFYQRSNDGGASWSAPVRVDQGAPPPFGLRRGADAQIAAYGDTLVAVWTTAGTDPWGAGPMVTALSFDGGRHWKQGPNPADDGSTLGHGFIDIAADQQGRFHMTWLDSRDGRQGVRYARSEDQGVSWTKNRTLKANSCECCPNRIATGPGNQVAVLFRDGQPRDMRVVLCENGDNWRALGVAGDFQWQFNGCPHVGGALAMGVAAVHTAVWTGQTGSSGVYYLRWSDGMWTPPLLLAAKATHPDLAVSGDTVAVAWQQSDGTTTSIWTAICKGQRWSAARQISGADAVGPRIVPIGDGFRVFWSAKTQTSGSAANTKLGVFESELLRPLPSALP